MNIENLLEEYRNGDEGKRLNLFLTYRDLRDHFTLIEQESPDDYSFIRFPWDKKNRTAHAA